MADGDVEHRPHVDQSQRGGETQIQAGRDIVVVSQTGLDIEAAKEIFDSRVELLRHELTVHVDRLMEERIGLLEERLLASIDTPEFFRPLRSRFSMEHS